MQENKLVDLSFEFAKSIVNLVDNIKAPKSSYMLDQLACKNPLLSTGQKWVFTMISVPCGTGNIPSV